MSKLYTITYESLFKVTPNDKEFFALVEGEEADIRLLCEKCSSSVDSSLHDFYSYSPARIKVIGDGEDLFRVFSTKVKNGVHNEEAEKMHIIKCNKLEFTKKIENQNNKRQNEIIGYQQVKVLSVKQAWNLYIQNMKHIGVNIYNEENTF